MPDQFLSINQAKVATGLCRAVLRDAISRGALKAYRPTPRRILIAAKDLDEFIRSAPLGPAPEQDKETVCA